MRGKMDCHGLCDKGRSRAINEDQFLIAIAANVANRPERAGMGTTLTLAYLTWPRTYVVHAGDSRCYLLRDSVLEQITRDHTLDHSLIVPGATPREAPLRTRISHVVWNLIGGSSSQLSLKFTKRLRRLGQHHSHRRTVPRSGTRRQ